MAACSVAAPMYARSSNPERRDQLYCRTYRVDLICGTKNAVFETVCNARLVCAYRTSVQVTTLSSALSPRCQSTENSSLASCSLLNLSAQTSACTSSTVVCNTINYCMKLEMHNNTCMYTVRHDMSRYVMYIRVCKY